MWNRMKTDFQFHFIRRFCYSVAIHDGCGMNYSRELYKFDGSDVKLDHTIWHI